MNHDTRFRSIVLAFAIFTAASLAGPAALSAQDDLGAELTTKGRVESSTGLFTLDADTTVRLTLVDTFSTPGTHTVRLKIFDAESKVLAGAKGVVSPSKPFTLELSRGEVQRGGQLRIRAVAIFHQAADECTGLHFSVELEDEKDNTTRGEGDCGCPCCGPPLPQGATGDCTNSAVI